MRDRFGDYHCEACGTSLHNGLRRVCSTACALWLKADDIRRQRGDIKARNRDRMLVEAMRQREASNG